jgi:SPP1 family phage portal protein
MAFIRTVISRDKDDNMIRKVEFWNASLVMHFRSVNGGYLNLESVEEHYWQDVPFTEYINNEERTGDFEGVVTMIDAYNKVQSNTANYFQYNDDAILKVLKLGDVSSNDIRDMKEKGAIILEDGGDVDWLLKQVDDTALENYKTRLREDIHTLANVPHLCDESFGGNLSGVAISYKLWGLEQMCAIKERKFKKGLQRRIELITNILNIMGHSFDYRDIVPKFRRNKPENNLETAQIVTMLSNDLSRETRLQMIPAVENVKEEIDKLEAEKKQDQEEFGVYENFAKAFQTAPEQTPEVTDGPEGTE